MKKIEAGTWITLAMIGITAAISHVKLEGQVETWIAVIEGKLDTLVATNTLEHEYINGKIDTMRPPVINDAVDVVANDDIKPEPQLMSPLMTTLNQSQSLARKYTPILRINNGR